MKRRILVTVLALLLALGALVTLNSGISRTALPIEMQVLTSLGDSGAAQGLMVDYGIRNMIRRPARTARISM